MDQPKIERLLRLIMLMTSKVDYTIGCYQSVKDKNFESNSQPNATACSEN